MSLRFDPPEPSQIRRGDGSPSGQIDQRIFPRIRAVKQVEISIGPNRYAGYTYDISQGGLSFIADDAVVLGGASIRISGSTFLFEGTILARQNLGKPGTARFHFEFFKSLDLVTLAGALGSLG